MSLLFPIKVLLKPFGLLLLPVKIALKPIKLIYWMAGIVALLGLLVGVAIGDNMLFGKSIIMLIIWSAVTTFLYR